MSDDPMERLIADALDHAGIDYTTPADRRDATGLDFRLDNGIEIEVKRFYTDRIGAQMATAENVVAVQGEQAIRWLAGVIDKSANW